MSEMLGQSGHALPKLQQPFGAKSGAYAILRLRKIHALDLRFCFRIWATSTQAWLRPYQ
jgi:hypothetical protein